MTDRKRKRSKQRASRSKKAVTRSRSAAASNRTPMPARGRGGSSRGRGGGRPPRRDAFRRAAIAGLVVGVGYIGISFFFRAPAPSPLSTAALSAARAAGCDPNVLTPVAGDVQRSHLDAGQPFDYAQDPPTSGPHDPDPLPEEPRVYGVPLAQTHAVHTLEHAAVIIYYWPDGPQGLSADVVDRLVTIAGGARFTYIAPYPTLPLGTSLAFTAWNKVLRCPAGITPDQAAAIANGFINSFQCTRNAPEPRSGAC